MKTIGIIGAGPAGLSAARILQDTGQVRAIVFEKAERIGGKSHSTPRFGAIHDLGTCYSTLAHVLTNRWMRELGVRQKPIGRQEVDGVALRRFMTGGDAFGAARETYRFNRVWRAQMRDFATRGGDPEVRAIAAAPIEEWLERHDLKVIRRFALRALTNMGYGFLDTATTVQSLRWCNPTLLLSGTLSQIKAPVGGWQSFWEKFSQRLDIRLGQPVTGLGRSGNGVEIATPTGVTRVDGVLVAAPLDELDVDRTPAERDVCAAVSWGSYVTTLAGVRGWYSGDEIVAFTQALEPGAPKGAMLSARPAGKAPRTKGEVRHFLTGQYGGSLSTADLAARLGEDLSQQGAHLDYIAVQRVWKYCPHYAPDAIRDGLLTRMASMQGEGNVWYSGAAFSFESVSNIVEHNRMLAPQIVRSLTA